MSQASFKYLLGFVVVFLGLAMGTAQGAQDVSQPYIVLIGIDQYADQQIKPRQFAETDVKALYDLFVSKDHLGVDGKHIKLLLGKADEKRKSEPATKENILKALTWLEKSAGKDDLAIFAFFGEGAPLGKRFAYFATDSTFKNRAKDAVAAYDIEHILDKIKTERFVALLDVNFRGFDTGKDPAPDASPNGYREFAGDSEAKDPNLSRTILLSNRGMKPSLNLDSHGIFGQVLLDALSGKADSEGYEPDGNVTIGELVKYLLKELPDLARKQGKTDDDKRQRPGIHDFQKSDFIVSHNPKAYVRARERLTKFDEIAKDKGLAPEIVEEGHTLLNRMPKLQAQQKLRKAYQKLADGEINLAKFETERKDITDSTVIGDKEAGSYAKFVLQAAGVVRRGYFKELTSSQLVDQAVRGLFGELDEKVPPAILERLDGIKSMKDADMAKLLADVRKHLRKREDLENGKDITLTLHAMLAKLDRHTDYIDPERAKKVRTLIEGKFTGIGVQIRLNDDDLLQVVTPIINSPAYKVGMLANDIITEIIRVEDDKGNTIEKPEVFSTKGITTEEAVKKIMGPEGTKVKLTVKREGEEKPLEFEIIRGQVETESVLGHKRNKDDSWNYVIDAENKICYIRLTDFTASSTRDLEKIMRRLTKEVGIKGFILDLRFNPGGLLDAAVKISDLFIEDGLIVSVRPRNGPETSYIGKADGGYVAFPMVCLVNGFSASASEIVSACLQDHHRAIVIGSRSYGKGSVQTIHKFENDSILKYTNATFWRPSGRNLNKASTGGKDEDEWGVTPNSGFLLDLADKERDDLHTFMKEQEIIRGPNYKPSEPVKIDFRDRQLDMALDYLRNQIKSASRNGTRKAG